MHPTTVASILALMLSLLGPAPADSPRTLVLKPGDKIVAIGDSITSQGVYLRDIDAVFAQQYPDLKIPPVVNKGISGQVAEQLVARFDRDVVQQKPAYVTIAVGINDVWHRLKIDKATSKPAIEDPKILALYKQNVTKMVAMAQAAGIKVILLTPTVIKEDPEAEGNKYLVAFVAAEKEIAAEKHCQLVDLHQMFLDTLAKKPKDVTGNWLTGDGVHPKEPGGAVMAIGVLRALGVPDAKIAATTPPPPPARRPATKPATKPAT
jgi:lysophospholipase L1-like esterase